MTRGIWEDLEVTNYRHEALSVPQSSFEADTDKSRK
jgi:hypothetical protein